MPRSASRCFELFFGGDPFGRDLAYLVRLVAGRKFDPQLAGELPWDQMPADLERLRNRDVAGKLALTVGASCWSLSEPASVRLFASKCVHRIDPAGAYCGPARCNQRHAGQYYRNNDEDLWIPRLHTK
jgi:hypothetical protein